MFGVPYYIQKEKGSNPIMQSLVILFSVSLWNMLRHQIHYALVEIMIHMEHLRGKPS